MRLVKTVVSTFIAGAMVFATSLTAEAANTFVGPIDKKDAPSNGNTAHINYVYELLFGAAPSDDGTKIDSISNGSTNGSLTLYLGGNDNDDQTFGTWQWTSANPNEAISALVLKSGTQAIGIRFMTPQTSGVWCTSGDCTMAGEAVPSDWKITNGNSNNAGALSNITAFSVINPAVPELSTWVMMLAGFSVTGFALRRRSVAIA